MNEAMKSEMCCLAGSRSKSYYPGMHDSGKEIIRLMTDKAESDGQQLNSVLIWNVSDKTIRSACYQKRSVPY
jgi:hypothetical protein